jgi:AraC-like DNA-binding protein
LRRFPTRGYWWASRTPCVVVGRAVLARTTHRCASFNQRYVGEMASSEERAGPTAVWEFASLLRMLVQPYLNEGRPDVAFAAELAGVSTRTLQRKLTLCGSSYSQILQEARFDLACKRLDDPALKVIDVAMMAGYGSPQHFTRAFRRIGGITPSEYRQYNAGGESDAVRAVNLSKHSPL